MTNLNYDIALKAGFPQCEFNPQTNRFEQTWIYIITKTGPTVGTEISHWELELCPNHDLVSVSKNGTTVPIDDASDLDILIFNPPNSNSSCLFDPNETVRVIKWDNLSNADVQPNVHPNIGEYNFTLIGCYQPGLINVAIKGGSNQSGGGCDNRTIIGPTCELEPSRGINFLDLIDIDIIE
ncbi:hypothetical protein BD780_002948 [Clostridium tetanomorphum]|uniref:Uncharacterized protein n=1 Tax=Clostridium tetanomorphum TaxID=1553 RepID=A0A923E8T0_CLOTT|nr:hypothetical protein [Clostridium tetanomorphum]KAJ53709.1 hypothetical protein CTM_00530 [Clostridium tetanomorphum DSM 665]MBC2397221.1 hypothetical protein [Clostridium tetanomorphum]MBP1862437.1 hypothetical protein [Clostridium tetanomorphum]NRS85723.1 hypothetical protein [Clostridium tetanomorphum]NRZ96268.1 hypothetical protein [Clostridium tetanomorphum]